MADYRLKVKVGEHEFEAEGPVKDVQDQFAAFKELVSLMPVTPASPNLLTPLVTELTRNETASEKDRNGEIVLDKIMKAEGRVVSLTVPAGSSEDAILLIMLGQHHYRGKDLVTGSEIADGLKQSGQSVDRTDRILNKLGTSERALILAQGERRGRTYRLTNIGIAKAREIARALIALVP